ncbi:MAG: hypothetical protein HQK55_19675 [Deltaproteobacteria bacterium]|nr:hypothetical protein [Deltaproteobacteria bacterium]
MALRHIVDLLGAEILCGDNLLDHQVTKVVATDMMSSVLAYSEPNTLLLTGLANIQVINTAEIASLAGIIFVKGLHPSEEVIRKAKQLQLPVIITPHSLYSACGLLYQQGICGI